MIDQESYREAGAAFPRERKAASAGAWRESLRRRIYSSDVERLVLAVIVVNAIVLGLQTDSGIAGRFGSLLGAVDLVCLIVFGVELSLKLVACGRSFWRSGWNWFDAIVVGLALVPGGGPFAVLRALRVLRILRLFTMAPSLRRVVTAFLHAIPGLGGVVAVMAVFYYAAGVLATGLFGSTHPQWFGSLGESLFSLFQIMTLESWSMGIVRPVMDVHPWAWAFFVPFITIATFTILNLFIGIIVSTMQELAVLPDPAARERESLEILSRIEEDLSALKLRLTEESRVVAAEAGIDDGASESVPQASAPSHGSSVRRTVSTGTSSRAAISWES